MMLPAGKRAPHPFILVFFFLIPCILYWNRCTLLSERSHEVLRGPGTSQDPEDLSDKDRQDILDVLDVLDPKDPEDQVEWILRMSHLKISQEGTIQIDPSFKRLLLDVGTSTGAPNSAIWLRNDPTRFVIAFEPNPFSYGALLTGRSKELFPKYANHVGADRLFKNFFPVNVALGEKSSKGEPFYCTEGDAGTSSLNEPTRFGTKQLVTVPVIRLDAVLKRLEWKGHIDHLKIDAQGHDLKILRGAGSFLRNLIVCVSPEWRVSGYKEAHGEQELRDYLSWSGFVYLNEYTMVNSKYKWMVDQGLVRCEVEGL